MNVLEIYTQMADRISSGIKGDSEPIKHESDPQRNLASEFRKNAFELFRISRESQIRR